MFKTKIIPNKSKFEMTFEFPDDYIGKELDVYFYKPNEKKNNKSSLKDKKTFKSISLDTKNFKFDRDSANER